MNTGTRAVQQMWIKKGLIYKPAGQHWWNRSHASVPTVDRTDDKIWRIYFGTRDERNRNRISYIDVEAGNPSNILYEHDVPVLDLGRLGTFDDCGVMPSWILNHDGKKYLYYIGWTARTTIPYHNSIGLAISTDGGQTFERFAEGPLIGQTYTEPFLTASCCVLLEEGIWKNWYLSGTDWNVIDGKPEPRYHIKYAESRNGIDWDREGVVAIDYKSEEEGGIARPSVLKEGNFYHMWYSYRSATAYRTDREASYRIGYAESRDGISWRRLDDSTGIRPSSEGWDSEMMEYAHVVPHHSTKYMFYNGNKFGHSGFGFAELSDQHRR